VAIETVIRTVRHAQSTYGAEQRYAGSVDVPLSDRGSADCVRAAAAMRAVHVDVVVTSTMRRAIDTARLLGYDRSRCIRTRLCDERRYGVLEGRTWQEVQSMEPPVLFITVGGESHSVNPEGGEPFEDVWQRAKRLHRLVLRRYEGQSILVFSHGVFLQMFHGVLRGSNCIESLADYPASLDVTTFELTDARLVSESRSSLLGAAGSGF